MILICKKELASIFGERRMIFSLFLLPMVLMVAMTYIRTPDAWVQEETVQFPNQILLMLPYFLTLLLFANAMKIGTDMIAGEKERGTMASLLVAPIRRSSIALGKALALMFISGFASIIYVGAMVVFLPNLFTRQQLKNVVTGGLQVGEIVMLTLLLVAIVFLYSAMILFISVFADSVKEASAYIMPVYLLVLMIGVATMYPTEAQPLYVYCIPIYSTSLALQEILLSQLTWGEFMLALASTLCLGACLIYLITRLFESERLMSLSRGK
jgi:sodium transport system permease protein